jgi:hypothetical protein
VTGTISSAAGGGIGGATVRFADGANAGRSGTTDGSGRYEMTGLATGGFTLDVTAPAHVNTSRGVTITAAAPAVTANFTLLPSALFTRNGSGANVFDMPTYITRVRINGTYNGSCENFIILVGGRLLVNEILGGCSIASGRTYEGTHLTSGGVVEVRSSQGINWTFTEVR